MSLNLSQRVSDCPVSLEDAEVVESSEEVFGEYVNSPTFEYAVELRGRTLGELEAHVSEQMAGSSVNDPERRDKQDQCEDAIEGIAVEVALEVLARDLGLPLDWLDDESGYAGDFLLSGQFLVEVKSAKLTSKAQNVPVRAYEYDDGVKDAWRKQGVMPDVCVFAYTEYDTASGRILVGFEGCEPLNAESRGLLYRDAREVYDGLYVYDRRYVRNPLEALKRESFRAKL